MLEKQAAADLAYAHARTSRFSSFRIFVGGLVRSTCWNSLLSAPALVAFREKQSQCLWRSGNYEDCLAKLAKLPMNAAVLALAVQCLVEVPRAEKWPGAYTVL